MVMVYWDPTVCCSRGTSPWTILAGWLVHAGFHGCNQPDLYPHQISALGPTSPFRREHAIGVWELPPSTMEGVCSHCAGTGAQTSSAGIPAAIRASAWAKERARTQLPVLADGRN